MDCNYTTQLISKNTLVAFCVSIQIIVSVFCLTFSATTQNNYPLIINLVDKDTSLDARSSLQKLQTLGLQTSFNNLELCSAYIYHLPAILLVKGYPAASVDFVQFDSAAAHINLFLGQQYKWVEVNTDNIEKHVLEQTGWNEK